MEAGESLAELLRWEQSGGTWRVLTRTPQSLTLALLTCDRGEQVGLMHTDDPQVIGHVGDRSTDEPG